MKKSRFTETQIVSILKQVDAGVPVKDICRQAGISVPTYYQWKSKYGGMEASDPKRAKELEAENARLKRMYAEMALDMATLSAVRWDSTMRAHYQQLRARGNLGKVALVACMHKLLRIVNARRREELRAGPLTA